MLIRRPSRSWSSSRRGVRTPGMSLAPLMKVPLWLPSGGSSAQARPSGSTVIDTWRRETFGRSAKTAAVSGAQSG